MGARNVALLRRLRGGLQHRQDAGPWRRTLALFCAIAGAMLTVWPVAPMLDLGAYDLGMRKLASWRTKPVDDQVVVALDQESLDSMGLPLALLHRELAAFLRAMADARAKAVALDIVLPERSFEAIAPGYDAQLVEGLLTIRNAGMLVLARTVDESGAPRAVYPAFIAAAGEQGSGFALFPSDQDGVVRRFDEALGVGRSRVDTLAGQLARRMGYAVGNGGIDFNVAAPPASVSMAQVLAWARGGDRTALSHAFKDRVVWLGAVLPFADRHRTPMTAVDESVPGVFVHVEAFRALRARRLIQPVPWWMLVGAGALAGCGFGFAASPLLAAGVAVTFMALALGSGWALLAGGWTLPSASLAVIGLASVLARLIVDTAAEIRARRRLRAVFAGYVSPTVMNELEAGRLEGLASSRRFVCVLFVDVRGFTTRAEQFPPEEVIETLNHLFEATVAAIHRHGGTVKEFMGDGVMAFFGAPAMLGDPVQAAFDAARQIFADLPAVNADLVAAGHLPLAIGMGLACGDAVVGHIGAASRYAYGAVGDCVNLASRLEGMTKDLGWPLLMSHGIRERLPADLPVEDLGPQAIKGHSAVRVAGWRPPA